MTISKENREFISNLIDYYISTAPSYRDMAVQYKEFVDSIDDTIFGMIVGSVYSSFMQVYQSQRIMPSLEDINEFNGIMMARAQDIKRAVLGQDVIDAADPTDNEPGP